MNIKDFCILNHPHLKIFAKTDHVADICRMLSMQLMELETKLPIHVYIGAHQWVFDSIPKRSINIGVQTEQYYDQNGKKLWAYRPSFFSYLLFNKFDYLIDYSSFNYLAYGKVKDSKRIIFGPYLFPEQNKSYIKSMNNLLLFVGDMSPRRQKLLNSIQPTRKKITFFKDKFYEDLIPELNRCDGIINIHHQKGVYTEWPRILMAYTSGKVVFSEALGYPLISGKHYLPLEEMDSANEDVKEKIYQNFKEEIAAKYKFVNFLKLIRFQKEIGIANDIICNIYVFIWALQILRKRLFLALLEAVKIKKNIKKQ
jgi:hypothetical protein